MSTEYTLTPDISIVEYSNRFEFMIAKNDEDEPVCTEQITTDELRSVIVRLVKVLSYWVEDPDEVLERFNVSYEDTK